MRIFPGKWGYEHTEYTHRAIELGYAPFYVDVPKSEEYLSLGSRESVFDGKEKEEQRLVNFDFLGKMNRSDTFVPVID